MTSMTYEEIFTMIQETGIPSAYNHFQDNTKQAPPYICFYYPSSDSFFADNLNYQKIETLYIEVYTANKDFEMERKVESVLRDHQLTFARSETYLDSEKMYMELYTLEVLIDEPES